MFFEGDSGGICARCQHLERAARGKGFGPVESRARTAAFPHRLAGLSGHMLIDLLSGGRGVLVLCVICGSHGWHVVRQSLLGGCPDALTPGKRLALADVVLGFLPSRKRPDFVIGKSRLPDRSLSRQGGTTCFLL